MHPYAEAVVVEDDGAPPRPPTREEERTRNHHAESPAVTLNVQQTLLEARLADDRLLGVITAEDKERGKDLCFLLEHAEERGRKAALDEVAAATARIATSGGRSGDAAGAARGGGDEDEVGDKGDEDDDDDDVPLADRLDAVPISSWAVPGGVPNLPGRPTTLPGVHPGNSSSSAPKQPRKEIGPARDVEPTNVTQAEMDEFERHLLERVIPPKSKRLARVSEVKRITISRQRPSPLAIFIEVLRRGGHVGMQATAGSWVGSTGYFHFW